MKNRAAYMVGLNKMEIRETPVPEPKAGEVLVKIEYVGICGSDVHYFKDGRCGDFVVDGELMLGHEAGGVVEKLGEGVTDLKVGDKVALEPGITCGHCEFCKSGRYNLCPDVVFLATPPVQGCNEDYITFPADMCFKLPEGMSTKEGALIEPFAVGLHAAHQGKVGMGDQCIILGSGCIGLMTLLACKACGATDITVVDMAQKRLDYAMKLGATRVINAKEKDVLKGLKSASGFLRRELGHALQLRYTPELQFIADDSIAYGAHILEVLRDPEKVKPANPDNDAVLPEEE